MFQHVKFACPTVGSLPSAACLLLLKTSSPSALSQLSRGKGSQPFALMLPWTHYESELRWPGAEGTIPLSSVFSFLVLGWFEKP